MTARTTTQTPITYGTEVEAVDFQGRTVRGTVTVVNWWFERVLSYVVRLPLADPTRPWEIDEVTIYPPRDSIRAL